MTEDDKKKLREMYLWYRRHKNTLSNKDKNRPNRVITNNKQILKIGKTDADILAGNSGTISIWRDNADTGEDETAHLDWMTNNEQVSSGKEVLIAWFQDESKWRIIGAECET